MANHVNYLSIFLVELVPYSARRIQAEVQKSAALAGVMAVAGAGARVMCDHGKNNQAAKALSFTC
uniref:Uncharacterized protein n=1 Tax=Rhizophora mucronata TaxID=61149 RepID=A0A2P2LUY8_RHIMU